MSDDEKISQLFKELSDRKLYKQIASWRIVFDKTMSHKHEYTAAIYKNTVPIPEDGISIKGSFPKNYYRLNADSIDNLCTLVLDKCFELGIIE